MGLIKQVAVDFVDQIKNIWRLEDCILYKNLLTKSITAVKLDLDQTCPKDSRFIERIWALENSIGIRERFIIIIRFSFILLSNASQSMPKI